MSTDHRSLGIRGVNHVGISCTDIEASLRFYRDLLGFEAFDNALEWDDSFLPAARITAQSPCSGRLVMLRAGNLYVELFQYEKPEPGEPNHDRPVARCGFNHIALEVTDVRAAYERLKGAGMLFHTEPVPMEGELTTCGRDPDGNAIELFEIVDDSSVTHGLDKLPAGGW